MANTRGNDMKKTLFISDLHLQAETPEITSAFLALLESNNEIDALYILGDLFEAWIGDDDDTVYHKEIIAALKAATKRGLKIYFLRGNRDFLIGKQFLRATGCELLADETVINLYGTPVLLMHGDTLCTRDSTYLRSRKYMRNKLIQTLFLWLPLAMRRQIADKMRASSNQHMQKLSDDMMDVTQQEVERVMQKHNSTCLIHGHTHRPNTHRFTLDNKPAARIVLAAWHKQGSALVWDETGDKATIEIG